jgi:protein SCO1/2
MRLRALLLLVVLGATGCGGSGGGGGSDSTAVATQDTFPAPPLSLRQLGGGRLTLAGLKGRPAVVTFVYSHCKNTCPLILKALSTYRSDLGAKANGLQIVAVSVDPAGDTPKAVRAFLKRQRLQGDVRYLLGSSAELKRTWKAWHIFAGPDPKDPEQREHTAAIYGVDASGTVRFVQVASPLDPATLETNVTALVKT